MAASEYIGDKLITKEVRWVTDHLRSGIVPDSLSPDGTVRTFDQREYFSRLLLGCSADRFAINLDGPDGEEYLALSAKSGTSNQEYPVNRIDLNGLRQVARREDDLRVGAFGYLLNPHEETTDALRFEFEKQPQLEEDWFSQVPVVKVEPRYFGRGVHLLQLYPVYKPLKFLDERQFVVVDDNSHILPAKLVFIPNPAFRQSEVVSAST